jgi:TonB-linked SusC/RagA family outer membrane protein
MRKAFFLLVACLFTGFLCYAQGRAGINLSLKNVPLEKVIDTLEKLTPYRFQYNSKNIRDFKHISVDTTNATISEILKICLRDIPLDFKILDYMVALKVRRSETITVAGKVIDQDREPVNGATVQLKGPNSRITLTDTNGNFVLNNINRNGRLTVSSVGFKSSEVDVTGRTAFTIQLINNQVELEKVTVSDGYQSKNRERAPGSFIKIDNTLLNRNISSKILTRLTGVASGLIETTNRIQGSNQPLRSIRGISTINAYSEPLIIVDNFPYDGNLENINPNDVESITIAKDAAAASIWGAFAGNGVIVVTTKKGRFDQPIKVAVNSVITAGGKPDLYYTPTLNPRDYVGVEEYLFGQGFYDQYLNFSQYVAVSPVVEVLDKHRRGLITDDAAEEQLEFYRMHDTRADRSKYFYKNIFNQQYAINLTGGTKAIRNYVSFGFDKDMGNLKRNTTNRITITANNAYKALKNRMELTTGIVFTQSNIDNNNTGIIEPKFPYLPLADNNGQLLPVPKELRSSYTDTAGGGSLLNWKYNPVDEMHLTDNKAKRTHYRVSLGLDYKLFDSLHILVNYQYSNEIYEQDDIKDIATYYTRNLINQFTQINYQTGQITRPVPVGGILDRYRYTNVAHNLRALTRYNKIWKDDHELIAIGGIETRTVETQTTSNRLYGYDKALQSSQKVNFETAYPLFYDPFFEQKIPDNAFNLGTTDHYFSAFTNAAYTYKQRYTLSASAREDYSNLFGVSTNKKFVPLWSVGASWEITKEDFEIPFKYLRLRATHGYTGNIDKTVSAYTTARPGIGTNPFSALQASLVNPPNKNLTWERIRMTNLAIDFASFNDVFTGSVEYYWKKGLDLIGYTTVDPTTGVSQYRGNSANIKGKGFDITLNAKIIDRTFGWKATLLLSHTTDRVSNYKGGPESINFYVEQPFYNPLVGYPLYSVFSYKWAGLNSQGNPVGSINGHDTTTNYLSILNTTDFNNLVYNGPATPTTFGSLTNIFSYKNFELYVNVVFKLGYYFRRSTINYQELYRGSPGHNDYTRRWQVPGDEFLTNVPTRPDIMNISPERDAFYTHSSILIEKGDHIRLQDVQLSYLADKFKIGKLSVPVRFSLTANNIGVLWKATKTYYDPDFVLDQLPNPLTVAAGLSFLF